MYFTLFKWMLGAGAEQSDEEIKAELMALEPMKLFWRLHDKKTNIDTVKLALQTPELLSKLTDHPFYDFDPKPFYPPKDGKAQSHGSLLHFLSRDRYKISLMVLTDPKLWSLLDDYDVHCHALRRNDVKATLLEYPDLLETTDPRFKKELYTDHTHDYELSSHKASKARPA